jgi:hypothetical protein
MDSANPECLLKYILPATDDTLGGDLNDPNSNLGLALAFFVFPNVHSFAHARFCGRIDFGSFIADFPTAVIVELYGLEELSLVKPILVKYSALPKPMQVPPERTMFISVYRSTEFPIFKVSIPLAETLPLALLFFHRSPLQG